jgi:hypothetical protein
VLPSEIVKTGVEDFCFNLLVSSKGLDEEVKAANERIRKLKSGRK